jgi:hypothetical protein
VKAYVLEAALAPDNLEVSLPIRAQALCRPARADDAPEKFIVSSFDLCIVGGDNSAWRNGWSSRRLLSDGVRDA